MTPATPLHLATFGRVHQNTDPFRYLGCTGCPVDSHTTIWLTVSKDRPIVIILPAVLSFFFPFSWFNRLRKQERCPECGSVYKMDYIGAEASHDDHHHDDHHSDRIDDGRKQTPSLICRRYWLSALLFPGRGGGFITQCSRGKTNISDSVLTDVRTEPIDLPTMADFVTPKYW